MVPGRFLGVHQTGLGLALMLLPLVWLSAVYFVGMIESSSLSWRWLRNILIYVEGVGVALCRTLLQSVARWYLLVSLFPILMLFHGWLLWVGTRMIVFCGIHVEHWWGSCFCRNGPWCCCGLYAPVSYMWWRWGKQVYSWRLDVSRLF